MNDTSGWIKIHRSITEHWLWSEPIKLFWWLDMLMLAKWSDEKNLVGNTLVEVKRGQLLASQSFLSQRWHVHKDTVRTFLHLLQNDEMIEQTTYPKYNLITICNYDKYQADANQTSNPSYDPNTNPNANPNSEPNIEEYKNIRNKENNNTPLTPQGGEQGSLFPDEEEKPKKSKKTISFSKELIALGVEPQIANDWIRVRQTKRSTQTDTAWEHVKRNLEKIQNEYGISPNDAIRICAEQSWSGCEVRFFRNIGQEQNRYNQQQTNDTDVYEYDSNGNKIKKQIWQ